GLLQLGPEQARILLERALAALEREHHSGELLREAVMDLLRDAPPLARHAAVDNILSRRLLQHAGEILRDGHAEIRLGVAVWLRRAAEDHDAPPVGADTRER